MPRTMKERLTLQFDGGSRGNPGPAGTGSVVLAEDGTPLVTLGRFIGRATNNVAEYRALITAIEEAKKLGAENILIRGDSELVIKQMTGVYRVKNPDMQKLYAKAKELLRGFASHTFEHNLRHHNSLADKLANLAMDKRQDVTEVNGDPAQAATPTIVEEAGDVSEGDVLRCSRCKCEVRVIGAPQSKPSIVRPFTCQCGGKMSG